MSRLCPVSSLSQALAERVGGIMEGDRLLQATEAPHRAEDEALCQASDSLASRRNQLVRSPAARGWSKPVDASWSVDRARYEEGGGSGRPGGVRRSGLGVELHHEVGFHPDRIGHFGEGRGPVEDTPHAVDVDFQVLRHVAVA